MGCNDKLSNTCGKKHNARCVDYEGILHDNTELDSCNCHSVHDVLEDIGLSLNDINEQIDLSNLGSDCITYNKDSKGRIIVNEALGKIEEELCKLKNTVEDTDSTGCPSIFSEDISCLNLDFGCLTTPCGDSITNLKDLLQALINNTCEHTHS